MHSLRINQAEITVQFSGLSSVDTATQTLNNSIIHEPLINLLVAPYCVHALLESFRSGLKRGKLLSNIKTRLTAEELFSDPRSAVNKSSVRPSP